jgi:hypothetical protein
MLSVLAGASRERKTDAIPGRWKALSVPSSAPRRSPRSEKLRINSRKSWYNNVEEVGTNGDFEVTFRLKRAATGTARTARLRLGADLSLSRIAARHAQPTDRHRALQIRRVQASIFLPLN